MTVIKPHDALFLKKNDVNRQGVQLESLVIIANLGSQQEERWKLGELSLHLQP